MNLPAANDRRHFALAHTVAAVALCLWPACAMAQAAPQHAAPPAAEASLDHAVVKGLTLKALLALGSTGVFYAGTGSLAATSILSGLVSVASYGVYVANEYLWDVYAPDTAAHDASFNASGSLGRNTYKFLTFKPAVMTADWSVVYAFTGSVAAMLTMGTGVSLVAPAAFYANNVGWDWYDWHSAAPVPPAPSPATSPGATALLHASAAP